jgi:hypothetical protein
MNPQLNPVTHQATTPLHSTELHSAEAEAEAEAGAEAEAYCRQAAGTLTPGIRPRWDPWPYICSVSRPLFFSFRCSSLLIKEGLVFLYIDWCSLTTPLHSAGLGSSLYSLGADPTESTACNNPSIVIMGDCLAIARILSTCLPAVIKQRHVPPRDRCLAPVLHFTLYTGTTKLH